MIIPIIISLLISFVYILNELYKRTNAYRNQFVDVRKFSVNGGVGDNLEIVNLGSTHPKFGFDYSDIDIKGENWAVRPQTFEYDFAILRRNVAHLSKGAVVVIPVCLLSFFLYRKNNRSSHVKYYGFLSRENIVGYSKKEKWSIYMYPLLFHPGCLRFLVKDVKKDDMLAAEQNFCKNDDELKKNAAFWIDCWNKEFSIKLPSPSLSQENRKDISNNIQILNEMIEYCLSKDLKPVLTILPVTSYLYSQFTLEYIERHLLTYIAEANKAKVPVLNYLADERFTDPSLYINTFFFNAIGRKKFTKQFIIDLRTQSII